MKGLLDDIGWVLWSGTIGLQSPVAARLEAARAAGFTCVTVSAPDVAKLAAQGTSAEELGRQLRKAGLDVIMEPVMSWYGGTPFPGPFAHVTFEDELRMCEALQVTSMTAIGPFRPDEVAAVDLPELFGRFCDRAADLGAQVQYEFMPLSTVRDVASAWAIVEAAGRSNGGLMFDTWHFFRGSPDYAALERVPGDRIFAVQISDATTEVHGSLAEDTFRRLLPGDGSFDLTRVLRALDHKGALRQVGPEIISPTTAAMAPVDAARLAGDRVRNLIARVRSPIR